MVKQLLRRKTGRGNPKTRVINFSTRTLGVLKNLILNQAIAGEADGLGSRQKSKRIALACPDWWTATAATRQLRLAATHCRAGFAESLAAKTELKAPGVAS